MPNLNFVFLFLFVLLSGNIHSQIEKLNRIKKSDLREKQHPRDSTASAAVLYSSSEITYKRGGRWQYVMEVTKRIKIYDKSGYNQSIVRIPLFNKTEFLAADEVSRIKATTYNLEGNKKKSYKIKDEDVFMEDKRDHLSYAVFTMPQIQDGSIIEYSYVVTSDRIESLPTQVFQEDIPVDYAAFQIEIPRMFAYRRYDIGFHDLKVSEDVINVSLPIEAHENGPAAEGSLLVKAKQIVIEAKDVMPINRENFVHNIDNYKSSIKLEMTGYRNFDEKEYKYINKTWDDVVTTVLENKNLGEQLNDSEFLKSTTEEITKDFESPKEKANAILVYLKNKMNWNNRLGISTQKNFDEVYDEGTGSVAEINYILTMMMRQAGLDAAPLLLSTRDHGIHVAPTLYGFNYVITAVHIDDDLYLYDASDELSAPNLLREETLNWKGRIIKQDGSSAEVNLDTKLKSHEKVDLEIDFYENNAIHGEVKREFTNYLANQQRRINSGLDREAYLEALENRNMGISILEHEISGMQNPTENINEQFTFEVGEVGDVVQDQIYVNPLFFLASQKPKFIEEDRSYPVDFSFPYSKEYNVIINLKGNLEVDWVPENLKVILPNNYGRYNYSAKVNENQIIINLKQSSKTTFIHHKYYSYLKEFHDQVFEKENEQIVLKKL